MPHTLSLPNGRNLMEKGDTPKLATWRVAQRKMPQAVEMGQVLGALTATVFQAPRSTRCEGAVLVVELKLFSEILRVLVDDLARAAVPTGIGKELFLGRFSRLELEHLSESGLSAFDPGCQHRLQGGEGGKRTSGFGTP